MFRVLVAVVLSALAGCAASHPPRDIVIGPGTWLRTVEPDTGFYTLVTHVPADDACLLVLLGGEGDPGLTVEVDVAPGLAANGTGRLDRDACDLHPARPPETARVELAGWLRFTLDPTRPAAMRLSGEVTYLEPWGAERLVTIEDAIASPYPP